MTDEEATVMSDTSPEAVVERVLRLSERLPGLSPYPPDGDMTTSDRMWFAVRDLADIVESVTAERDAAVDRIEQLEADLAVTVQVLEDIAHVETFNYVAEFCNDIPTLRRLLGEDDDR